VVLFSGNEAEVKQVRIIGIWVFRAWVLIVVCTPVCPARPPTPMPPPAAFGTPPRTSNVQLSFDGKSAAWFDLGAVPERIIVFDLVNNKDKRVFLIPAGTKLRDLEWADDDTLIFTASATVNEASDPSRKFEVFRTFAADLGSGKAHMLLADDPDQALVTGATLLAAHTAKPKTAIMSSIKFNTTAARMQTGSRVPNDRNEGWAGTLFEVDTRTGKSRNIDQGTQFTSQWVIDADGNSVARSEWDQKSHNYTVLAKRGSGWSAIFHRDDGNQLQLFGLTDDRKAVVAVGIDKDGRSKLLAIPLDGTEQHVLFEDPVRGVTAVTLDRFDKRPIRVYLDGATVDGPWLDPVLQQRFKALSASFPGSSIDLQGQSADKSRLVARVSAPDKPAIYYLIDYTTHKADILSDAYPELADVKLGKVSEITYKARDGTEIPAYLTSPPGYAGSGPLSLVVIPHGGPAARDFFEFDWLAQFVASRGYLVLQPQFRGSTGFGEKFRDAGIHEWGGLMQDDVTDGVKALIDQHLADPHHVCILGASYGGYAALAGAAFTPDLYSCAISINGVFDLPLMQTYEEKHSGRQSDTALYWREHIGSPIDPKVVAASPNRYSLHVTAHVLLIHATDDTVVPPEQSDFMANSLRAGGKSITLLKIPGDDHWLSGAETRVQVLKAIDTFLQANLPN
jgi:dipeptidyl aminopeptidase/acylaminoacyl peptidase